MSRVEWSVHQWRLIIQTTPTPSYHVYIDENADAAGNYTVLARGTLRNNRNQTVFGLLPAGTFSHKGSSSYGNSDALPVSKPRMSLLSLSVSV